VDFWADWCAPCRVLMPILARLADEFGGKFLVAKVNTEEQRELTARYQIRSLPTVKLFRNGEVMDEFMGALPEGAIREFLDRYIERASDRIRQEARSAQAAGNTARAIELLRSALNEEPENYRVHLDLIQVLMEHEDYDEAEAIIRSLPASQQTEPDFSRLRNRLHFALVAKAAPAPEALARAIEANPSDLQARYQLGARKVMAGDYEGALALLLEVMRRDRGFEDDGARKGMLAVFDLLGGQGPLISRYRGLMSSTLY
jgi:putative thioredoxin